MTGVLPTAVIVVSLVLCVGAVVLVVADKSPGPGAWLLLAGLEAIVVGYAVVAVVTLATTTRTVATWELLGYLAGMVVLLPAAAWWIRDERTRAAAGVLVVALLVLPFLVVRVQQVWSGG